MQNLLIEELQKDDPGLKQLLEIPKEELQPQFDATIQGRDSSAASADERHNWTPIN